MGLRNLKQHADRLALDAARLKAERDVHAARCLSIVRARLATPGALALCFGAGMLVGRPAPRGADRAEDEPESRAARLLKGPLAAAAFRLASAYLAGAATGPVRAP